MQTNKTVIIKGRRYDAVTGLPVDKDAVTLPAAARKVTTPRASTVAAKEVHSTTQRSQTLNRRAAKKPVKRPQTGRHMDISRSKSISKFAPHPAAAATPKSAPVAVAKPAAAKTISSPDIAPKTHPTAARAIARTAPAPKAAPKKSKQTKEAAISKALSTPTPKPPKQKRIKKSWTKRFTILTALFALLVIAGVLTFINLPVLSVGFAASQAGIKATYPEYRPDGYSLSQPVTFSDGEVTLVFKSNSSDTGYTIKQTRSSWDSSAVLDNVVRKQSGENYVTYTEKGLTIYSYEETRNAAWVNAGILYEIETTAPLSGEQIRRIATSL
jgi:hypothetical protein